MGGVLRSEPPYIPAGRNRSISLGDSVTQPEAGRRRQTAMQVLRVGGVVAAIALLVWWLPLGSDSPPATQPPASSEATTSHPPPDSRPRPGQIEDYLPLPAGKFAYAVAWDGTSLWVLAADEPVAGGNEPPADATVLAVDPETAEVTQELSLSGGPSDIAVDADGVWVLLGEQGSVTQLDPVSGDVVVTADLSAGPEPVWLELALGAAVVGIEDGAVQRVTAFTGEVDPITELTPDKFGQVLVDGGEVWILSSDGDPSATLVDPLEAAAEAVTFDEVEHPVTHGGFYFEELGLGGAGGSGSVVTMVDRVSLQPSETVEMPGILVYVGGVAGSFGALDEQGVFQRFRPTEMGPGRFQTSWDGESSLFSVDQELWMMAGGGASLDRVVLTGTAD